MMKKISLIVISAVLVLVACSYYQKEKQVISKPLSEEFKQYWYDGTAEVNVYELKQARYGEIHEGELELIFVTEDFSRKKLVKLDDPQSALDKVPMLKLNIIKKFTTGVYPYSMMSSVFSPIDGQPVLKVTTSSQEWCGHTFMQFTKNRKGYDYELHSYFEIEGEESGKLEQVILEDEIFNKIRLNPFFLPVGELKMIPSSMYLRLMHQPIEAYKVNAKREELGEKLHYTLYYPELKRNICFTIGKYFPYEVLSWKEFYTSGFGSNAQSLSTTAVRKNVERLDYWNKNNAADSVFRGRLYDATQ